MDAAVAAARRAFDDPGGWSQWEPAARAEAIERLAAELEAVSRYCRYNFTWVWLLRSEGRVRERATWCGRSW